MMKTSTATPSSVARASRTRRTTGCPATTRTGGLPPGSVGVLGGCGSAQADVAQGLHRTVGHRGEAGHVLLRRSEAVGAEQPDPRGVVLQLARDVGIDRA